MTTLHRDGGSIRWTAPTIFALLFAACDARQTPTGADRDLEPSLQRGGIPGPPSDVVLPGHIGPPPHVPPHVPPNAGPPNFLSSIVAIGAGTTSSCALRSDGAVFCWGNNAVGQLGDGTLVSSAVPVRVAGGHVFTQLFVGDRVACGLTADGQAYCWGFNSVGQLGSGAPVGTTSSAPALVAGGHRFRTLGVGLTNTCGVATGGVAWCWGRNLNGQLGSAAPPGDVSVVPVAVANTGSLGLVSIDSGNRSVCGLNAAGSVFCWGGDFGDFGNGAATVNGNVLNPTAAASGVQFSKIELGSLYACGLGPSGVASCWGNRDLMGEQGRGFAGVPSNVPATVVGGLTFTALDADDNNPTAKTTCGVTPSGDAWCWGSNEFGQLGAPSSQTCQLGATLPFPCSPFPVRVMGSIAFRSIAVGDGHTCGLAIDDSVYCWGWNAVGQLGNGTTADSSTPVAVGRM